MYYGSGTVAQTASKWRDRGFSRNDNIAAILKVWRHIRNPTPSIDAYSAEEESCKISSGSDVKRRSLRLFYKKLPQQDEEREWDE